MSGKIKKKKGQVSMTLSEFHENTPSAAPVSNWAEEMDKVDGDSGTEHSVAAIRAQLPTAPKSAQALDIPDEKIPRVKPFRVYISSVSFEATDDMVRRFFAPMPVEGVHLVNNERGTGHRGFGHVDFDDRESLIESLSRNDTKLHTRNVRITLEEPRSDRQHHTNRYDQSQGSGSNAPLKSDESNWRRTEPEPEPESSDRFSSRVSRGGGAGGGYQSRGTSRGGFSGENRRGGYSQRQGDDDAAFSSENRRGGYGYRHQQGEEEGGYQRRPFNRPRGAPGGDRQFQPRDRVDAETHHEEETPVERPRLQLAPRSKPIEVDAGPVQTSASIFGAAKPVDTAARERAIEDKLKAEREEKARRAAEEKQHAGEQETVESRADVEVATSSIVEPEQHRHEEEKKERERRPPPPPQQQHEQQQFYQAPKTKSYHQDGNNNTRLSSGARRGGYKAGEGKVIKSPSGDSGAWKTAGDDAGAEDRPQRTFNRDRDNRDNRDNRERRGGAVSARGGERRGGGGSGGGGNGGAAGKFGPRPADREKRRPAAPETLSDKTPTVDVKNKFLLLNVEDVGED